LYYSKKEKKFFTLLNKYSIYKEEHFLCQGKKSEFSGLESFDRQEKDVYRM